LRAKKGAFIAKVFRVFGIFLRGFQRALGNDPAQQRKSTLLTCIYIRGWNSRLPGWLPPLATMGKGWAHCVSKIFAFAVFICGFLSIATSYFLSSSRQQALLKG
jgi:hypothetical protein